MSAHYDTYDYPSYWIGRDYEHKSELIALNSLLRKIKKIKVIAEYGAGYGRLVPTYFYRADKIILSDSSARLLKLAREKYKSKKIRFIQSRIEKIDKKIKKESIDLVILVRVLHHIKDLDKALTSIYKTLKPGGFLIVEFANKKHLKAVINQFIRGNLTYPIDIFSRDIRSKKNIKKKTLPFINYHPDYIKAKLEEMGFIIIDRISVSNIRIPFLKRYVTIDLLLKIEKFFQNHLSVFNIGPSIFVLAQKKD
jgi:ubiquinone/menaquinone biosynthesis C-methylase UbiE